MKSSRLVDFFKKYFVLILLGLFSLTLVIISLINKVQLNGHYIYVLGKIENIKPYRSGSTIYDISYFYRGIRYTNQRIDPFWHKDINDLFFIKILLKKKHEIGDIEFIDGRIVPYCFTIDSVPKEGWPNLPVDPCGTRGVR